MCVCLCVVQLESLKLFSTAERLGLLSTLERLLVSDPAAISSISLPLFVASLGVPQVPQLSGAPPLGISIIKLVPLNVPILPEHLAAVHTALFLITSVLPEYTADLLRVLLCNEWQWPWSVAWSNISSCLL